MNFERLLNKDFTKDEENELLKLSNVNLNEFISFIQTIFKDVSPVFTVSDDEDYDYLVSLRFYKNELINCLKEQDKVIIKDGYYFIFDVDLFKVKNGYNLPLMIVTRYYDIYNNFNQAIDNFKVPKTICLFYLRDIILNSNDKLTKDQLQRLIIAFLENKYNREENKKRIEFLNELLTKLYNKEKLTKEENDYLFNKVLNEKNSFEYYRNINHILNKVDTSEKLKIAFVAPSCYGKSTAVKILESKMDAKNIKIAEPLYEMQKAFYEKVNVLIKEEQDGELLQFFGSKVRKENPGYLENVFTNKLNNLENEIILNDDVRPLDFEFMKKLGFIFVKINGFKRDRNDKTKANDNSSLEWKNSVVCDYTVDNLGTLEEYENNLMDLMEAIKNDRKVLSYKRK